MANHKRGRRKSLRAGCLFCKPHKADGTKKMTSAQTLQERRAREAERLDTWLDDGLLVRCGGARSEEKDEPASGDGTTT